MARMIKDTLRFGTIFLKICLFFIPIIAVVSSLTGIMTIMMDRETPAIEMGMGSPPVGNEMVIPMNYSIKNPTAFKMQDYQLQIGMDFKDKITNESVFAWSNALVVGEIPAGETVVGKDQLIALIIPSSVDILTKNYTVSIVMRISFRTAFGLANIMVEAQASTMDMGPGGP
jgi:hypothetical protein